MSTERGKYGTLILGPGVSGKDLILHFRELLRHDKKKREAQINIKVQAALAEVLGALVTKAKEAVPHRAHIIDEIAVFINADRVLKSALTAGAAGRTRVEEVFLRARLYIDDFLENPMWQNESSESKEAMRALGGYMTVASRMIMDELEEVRKVKANIQQQNTRIKKILDALGDPRESEELFGRAIPDVPALAQWVRDVSNYYLNADDKITTVIKKFRPAYVKAWEEFVDEHYPFISDRPVGKATSYKSGRRFEDHLEELLSRQLLSNSMEAFQKLAFKDVKTWKKVGAQTSSTSLKGSVPPPIEMKANATAVEILLKIPDHLVSDLARIQSEAFLDLSQITNGQDVLLTIESSKGGRTHYLVCSTTQARDREWIGKLQKFMSELASGLI